MEESPDMLSFTGVFDLGDPRNQMIYDVASNIHDDQWMLAAKIYGDHVRKKTPGFVDPANKEEMQAVVLQLMHWCLNNDRYPLAARLLWTDNMFDARPHFTKMIWEELKRSASIMLMGSASASKSYSTGVWLLLDWVRDPENTTVKLLGPSEKHLSEQLFTHIINLHDSASIPLPGTTGDLWIGLDRKNKFGAISGVVVPLGKKSAGRLQGGKKGKRKKKHPVFGEERRMRVFMDESEKIPPGIWKDVDNIFSNMDGVENFKIVCAFNPENQNGESGTRCEPPGGWLSFDIDKDERWISKRGWSVVRLDQMRSENIIHKRKIFAGLQVWESLNKVIENAGGYNSPGYYTMVRAAFPPSSVALTIIPQGLADAMLGTVNFFNAPTPCAGIDLALEGADAAKFALGEYGLATGYTTPPTKDNPRGETINFVDAQGNAIFRPCLQVNQIFLLDKGDTTAMALQIKELCQKIGIKPAWVMLDRTGNGQGVLDVLIKTWSIDVSGINFFEAASETKIIEEDQKTAKEEYDRACSELWFAVRKYGEFKLMFFSPLIDRTELFPQLTGRQYHPLKLSKVESKKDYKARNAGKSPDSADSVCLLLAGARRASGDIPSMKINEGRNPYGGEVEDRDGEKGFTDYVNRAPADIDEGDM